LEMISPIVLEKLVHSPTPAVGIWGQRGGAVFPIEIHQLAGKYDEICIFFLAQQYQHGDIENLYYCIFSPTIATWGYRKLKYGILLWVYTGIFFRTKTGRFVEIYPMAIVVASPTQMLHGAGICTPTFALKIAQM
jgi:hypothetical protein